MYVISVHEYIMVLIHIILVYLTHVAGIINIFQIKGLLTVNGQKRPHEIQR